MKYNFNSLKKIFKVNTKKYMQYMLLVLSLSAITFVSFKSGFIDVLLEENKKVK